MFKDSVVLLNSLRDKLRLRWQRDPRGRQPGGSAAQPRLLGTASRGGHVTVRAGQQNMAGLPPNRRRQRGAHPEPRLSLPPARHTDVRPGTAPPPSHPEKHAGNDAPRRTAGSRGSAVSGPPLSFHTGSTRPEAPAGRPAPDTVHTEETAARADAAGLGVRTDADRGCWAHRWMFSFVQTE